MCPGRSAQQFIENSYGWLTAVCGLADDIRDVNWALWHQHFQTAIGLQTFMIKGHAVINTPDTCTQSLAIGHPGKNNKGHLGQ